MRDLIFRLDTEWCVDGVELVRRDPPGVKWLSKAGPTWFSWRSNRHERGEWQATDLGDPLVIRFLNASNDDKLIKFLSMFGLPDGFLLGARRDPKKLVAKFLSVEDLPKGWALGASGAGLPAAPRNFVRAMQRRLHRLLEDAAGGDAARKDKARQHALHFVSGGASAVDGRLALTAPTLIAFMHFEVYMTIENGAHLGRCKQCRDLFLFGRGTRRRSTGTYCSGRCRTGAHRAAKRGS